MATELGKLTEGERTLLDDFRQATPARRDTVMAITTLTLAVQNDPEGLPWVQELVGGLSEKDGSRVLFVEFASMDEQDRGLLDGLGRTVRFEDPSNARFVAAAIKSMVEREQEEREDNEEE